MNALFRIFVLALLGVAGLAGDAAAYYNPSLGRFMQRDPAGYVDGMNLYRYGRSNPHRFVDPMGLQCASTTKAPEPNIDKSCTTNPLDTCKSDSRVKEALERYYSDCASSSRGGLTIICGTSNKHRCSTQTVTYKGSGCGSLAHEILHAADSCVENDNCDLSFPNRKPDKDRCKYFMCAEARSSSYASCCDPNNPWRKNYPDWSKCVEKMKERYIKTKVFGCPSQTDADKSSWWDSCAAGSEAAACNGPIPKIKHP